jgi:diacylglycerol kinase (ATP)
LSWKNQSFRTRLRFALHGLAAALRSEQSLKLQAAAFAAALAVLVVLRPPPVWWALVLLASALVVAAELLNTALEALADHLHPGEHARIRLAKDCAAAAVLVAALGALGVAAALALELLRR